MMMMFCLSTQWDLEERERERERELTLTLLGAFRDEAASRIEIWKMSCVYVWLVSTPVS